MVWLDAILKGQSFPGATWNGNFEKIDVTGPGTVTGVPQL
jgi:hypothetical protein